MHRSPRIRTALFALVLLSAALSAVPALAETNGSRPYFPPGSTIPPLYQQQGCWRCHSDFSMSVSTEEGPHHNYLASTDNCELCHTVHNASGGTTTWPQKPASSGSVKLLPAATIADSCVMCHDGTGGSGVYGTIAARGLGQPASGHRSWPETTSVVPGGDAASGGGATVTFRGLAGHLTCSDCHTPHGSNMVNPYYSDRFRNSFQRSLQYEVPHYGTKLLKQKPTSATTAVADYGSGWCEACHKGRHSGGAVVNHPVDSELSNSSAYNYRTVPQEPAVSTGITVDQSGNVYVCDPGNRRVQKFTGTGMFVTAYYGGGTDTQYGLDQPKFYWPSGIAVRNNTTWVENDGTQVTGDVMLVNDALWGEEAFHNGAMTSVQQDIQGELPGAVAAFSANTGYPGNWMSLSVYAGTCQVSSVDYSSSTYYWRSSDAVPGLYGPQGIAAGPGDADQLGAPIYVADTFNNRIVRAHYYVKLQPPLYLYHYIPIGSFGTKGTGNGQFDHPGAVACDSAGNVYVADGNNDRVQKFDANGSYLAQWGTSGTAAGQFDWPDGIAIDSAGHVFVADRNNARIQEFDTSGTFIRQWGTQGSADGQFQFNGSVSASDVAPVYQYGELAYPYDGLGVGNGGYLMTDRRTSSQKGHSPICQQCHEDARTVGQLKNGGAQPSFFKPAVDGSFIATQGGTGPGYGNPRFQDFPHESTNPHLLVENDDDLCLNCHAPTKLP